VITLGIADLAVIASRTLGLDTGQVLDLLDTEAAERALAQARPGSGPGGTCRMAAALLCALVRERPLQYGNQPVALAAMLQFLALNGWQMNPDPPGPVAAVVADVAAGRLDTTAVAGWLEPRLRPSDRQAADLKEAAVRARQAMPLAEWVRRATRRRKPRLAFERFTDRARRAVILAREEARMLDHNQVDTGHLLLGMLHEGGGVAVRALEALGIDKDAIRQQIELSLGQGRPTPQGHIPFSPLAREVLAQSRREALALGHHYIGTEHLLLAILRHGQQPAAQVLTGLGTDHAQVQDRVLRLLASEGTRGGLLTQLAADVAGVVAHLTQVRCSRQAAVDAGDRDAAAALTDQERQLSADRRRLESQLTATSDLIAENERLRHDVECLRDLLRRHGVEPDDGSARSA
jgi:hypothetical protein